MNDERPIEKLLRRYADKRRAESGPPPELHPATRRLLQGEVARQFPPARPAQAGGFLALLQGRWIYAATCLLVAGIGITLVRYQDRNATPLADKDTELSLAKAVSPEPEALALDSLAQRTDKQAADAKLETAIAPVVAADAAAPRAELADRQSVEDAAATRTPATKPVARTLSEPAGDRYSLPQPATPAPSAKELSSLQSQPQSPTTLAAPTLAESKPAPTGVATVSTAARRSENATLAAPPAQLPASELRARSVTLARGGGFEQDSRTAATQSFANVAGPSEISKAESSPAANVLMNFRVEQAGNQWRVIDGDGSTYLGELAGAAGGTTPPAEVKQGVASFSAPGRTQALNYSRDETPGGERYQFRVEGTNRTLKQQVSFAWNFVAPTNQPGAPTQNVQALPPPAWTEAAINGRVLINPGTQFELNAAPTKP